MNQRADQNNDVRALILLLACAGVIVLGCLVLNGFTWVHLQNSSRSQSLALDRLAKYSAVLSTLQDVELGQRGYVISGDDYHLTVFNGARDQFSDDWQQLVALEAKDGRLPKELREIRDASEELIRYANEIVYVRETQGNEAAERIFILNRPRFAMMRMRELYAERMREVQETIRERSMAAEDDFQAGLATSMAMGVLALGIGGICLVLLRRVLTEISRTERYALSMLKAEEARRQKDVFLAMMSHEIRTPLNAIIGFGQLAQREEMGEKGTRYVKSILEGGQSLLLLINDILDLSKLQAGRMELQMEAAPLKEMLAFLERLFQESCAAKGINFHLDYQDDIPGALVMDSVRLRQVLMNLVGNAVKFTEAGEVMLKVTGNPTAGQEGRWDVCFVIRDTGAGIPAEDMPHVFEPFYQSVARSGVHTKGTGLGLSIVNRFVTLMEGTLAVKSELDEGTEFTIQLNGLQASSRIDRHSSLALKDVDFDNLKSSRILAVDDNATNRELIREIFSGSHHVVETADDGEEAVRMIREMRPDLVLMDLRMPVKDGPTAAREIKTDSTYRLTPIIAVTAGSLPGQEEDSLPETPFDGALRKPFTRAEMYEALAMFIPEMETKEGGKEGIDQERVAEEIAVNETVDPRLVGELKEILMDEWPEVRSGMTISEVVEFSERIDELADEYGSKRLRVYSKRLRGAAESFSFGEMENMLGRYPDLVAEMEGTLI